MGQTAIRGVAASSAANFVSRALGFGTHVAITFYIGLSAELDAYFVATSIVAVSFFVVGDAFDSIAVPGFVDAVRRGNLDRFREIAGALLVLSGLVAGAAAVLVAVLAPWAHLIAPGLPSSLAPEVLGNLAWLAPLALAYLPCRALGSMLRSRRWFLAASLGDVCATGVTLACLLTLHSQPFAIAKAASVGGVAAALLLAVLVGRARFSPALRQDLRHLGVALGALVPIYFVVQLLKVVDRVFASYLPTGAISAISYGQMIVLVPSTILVLDSIFMVPLAEASDKRAVMRRILDGVLVVAIPIAAFSVVFAADIVAAAFQRGRFDAQATDMTAQAVRFLALGIPPIMLWPTCYRLFQVVGRTRDVLRLVVLALACNTVLNGLSLYFGLGVAGLALATTIANYLMTTLGIARLSRLGVAAADPATLGVVGWMGAISGVSLGLSRLAASMDQGVVGLLLAGAVFLAATAVGIAIAPATRLQQWRRTVARDLLASWRPTGTQR